MKIFKEINTDFQTTFKPNDVVWACGFRETDNKNDILINCPPTKGKLMCAKTEQTHDFIVNNTPNPKITFFVPFKKNKKELAWSKAVSIWSRSFATTEDDCRDLYKSLIDDAITNHQNRISELCRYKHKI